MMPQWAFDLLEHCLILDASKYRRVESWLERTADKIQELGYSWADEFESYVIAAMQSPDYFRAVRWAYFTNEV